MAVSTLRPKGASQCEISGMISYNLLESVPICFTTTASPFAETMWKALCGYCEAHCVAYKLFYRIDGKQIASLNEKDYLIGSGDTLN